MEADNKSADIIETGQEIGSLDVNKSGETELLDDGQNELEEVVVIYNNESEEGQEIKVVTNTKSEGNASEQNPDPNNVITPHASSNDCKDETIKEDFVPVPSQEATKTAVLNSGMGDSDSDDDETIVILNDPTGHKLILYSVVGWEEVCAVGQYDSDELPERFYFMLRDDVKRYAKEGLIRRIKKPLGYVNEPLVEIANREIKLVRACRRPVVDPTPASPKKKMDIPEKNLITVETEIEEVCQPKLPKVQQEVMKVGTKNDNINSETVTPVKQTAEPAAATTQV